MDIVDLHARMIRDLFLRVEIMLNERIQELAEYDIQAFMFLFFRRHLINSRYTAARERNRKVDCVLYDDGDPICFYEIKTYFKESETINKSDFDRDIQKLKGLVSEKPGSKCYFVVVGKKSKFDDLDNDLKDFVEAHVVND